MIRYTIPFLVFVFFSISTYGQEFIMDGNDFNACGGIFLDSGGSTGNYGPNENFEVTICSDGSTGTHIRLTFSGGTQVGADALCFFDGSDSGAPALGCVADFAAASTFIIQATAEGDGCLTVTFNSDGSDEDGGWAALIECIPSCQIIESILVSSDPMVNPVDTGWIDVCPDQRVFFTGAGGYPQNGVDYQHSDATSSFEWNFGDGATGVGPNVSHTYEEPGGYIVQLTITDQLGCTNTNFLKQRVRVSTRPEFNIGGGIPEFICAGDTVQLGAAVNSLDSLEEVSVVTTEGSFLVQGIRSDSLALPDGSGVSYQTSIGFVDFTPGQVLVDVNDLLSICVNMEHSYMNDLDISLTCPDGTTVVLQNFSGFGEVFLGEPIDDDDSNEPGIGYDYCWTSNATNGTWTEYEIANSPSTLPAGNYNTFGDLEDFIGCPLNGEWEISITDNLFSDNGFIFSWSINFSEDLYPNIETFTPTIESYGWLPNPSITSLSQDSIIATPINAGTANYTFEVVDGFGCAYDTMVNFTVLPKTHPDCFTCVGELAPLQDIEICEGDQLVVDGSLLGVLAEQDVTYEAFPNGTFSFPTHPPANPFTSPIDVNSVYPNTLTDPVNQIRSICIDIEHTFNADVSVFLQSPNGQLLELTTNNGAGLDNYTNTCFTPAATMPIQGSFDAPFTGDWQPEGDWNDLAGATTNGTWNLLVSDNIGLVDVGVLNSWSITFNTINDVTYNWSPASAFSCQNCPNPEFIGTAATTQVTESVIDVFGCTHEQSFEVKLGTTIPAPVLVCGEPMGGQIVITWDAVAGASGYEVQVDGGGWIPANGTLSHTVSGLSNGDVISVWVQGIPDQQTCTAEVGMIACNYQVCALYVEVTGTINPPCSDSNEGAIYVSANDGISPIDFTIDGGPVQPTGSFIGLSAGMHQVVITDSQGCTDSIDVELIVPNALLVDIMSDSVSCNGGMDGQAVAIPSGGTAPYSFTWQATPFVFNDTISNLGAGSYFVSVSDDNGCDVVDTVEIFEPPLLDVMLTVDSVSCNGGNDGAASATGMGGTPAYSFDWSNGTSGAMTTGFTAGMHMVTITDAKGCFIDLPFEIFEPDPMTLMSDSTDVSCSGGNDGTATAIPMGGNAPFTYSWDHDNTITTATATGLVAGTYTANVTDSKNCTQSITITINEPTPLDMVTGSAMTLCYGSSDGTANVVIGGATPPYTFAWNTNPVQTTQMATGLAAGTYTVVITDLAGCQDSTQVTVGQPDSVTLQFMTMPSSCINTPDGTANVTAMGGLSPYSYNWENGSDMDNATGLLPGAYLVTVTDANNCETIDTAFVAPPDAVAIDTIIATNISCFGETNGSAEVFASGGTVTTDYDYLWDDPLGQLSNPAINLAAGTYNVTVTDDNGCTDIQSVTIQEPSLLTASTEVIDALCLGSSDGIASAIPLGGTAPYTYTWSDMQTDSTAVGLAAGTYTITVSDANNCMATAEAIIDEPATAVTATIMQNYVGCFAETQGVAEVTGMGGTGAVYTYEWSDGQTAATATSLAAQTYYVTVSDQNGCEALDTIEIAELDAVDVSIIFVEPSCFGFNDGQLGVNVTGGLGMGDLNNYTYQWSTAPVQTTPSLNNLLGGQDYFVTVTDAQGCTGSATLFLDQPSAITLSASTVDVSCNGSADGEATITASGDHNDYTYLWDLNAGNQTTNPATGLTLGNYAVTITDSTGCVVDTFITINQPEEITIDFETDANVCSGEMIGAATAIVGGGTPGYMYTWSNGATTDSIGNLSSGVYYLTIVDSNGCEKIDSINVSEPSPLGGSAVNEDVTCFGDRDGRIEITPTGGTPPYLYSIDGENYNGASTIVGLTAGLYTAYVIDANGCTWSTEQDIANPPEFMIDAGEDVEISLGDSIQLQASYENNAGLVDITWFQPFDSTLSCIDCLNPWSNTQNTITYEVYGIDANGCDAEDKVQVRVIKERSVYVPTGFTPNGDNTNDVLMVHGKEGTTITAFRVYDRWGETLYEVFDFDINDPTLGWDGSYRGKDMNPGVYVWYLEVEYVDGQRESFKGHTTLLR